MPDYRLPLLLMDYHIDRIVSLVQSKHMAESCQSYVKENVIQRRAREQRCYGSKARQ